MGTALEPEWEPEREPQWNQDGNLNGDLNGNLNGNLDGNLNGDLDRNLNGNQPGTKLGLNLDQKVSLAAPCRVLEDPWVVFGGPWRVPLGTKLGPKTSPAQVQHGGPKMCL